MQASAEDFYDDLSPEFIARVALSNGKFPSSRKALRWLGELISTAYLTDGPGGLEQVVEYLSDFSADHRVRIDEVVSGSHVRVILLSLADSSGVVCAEWGCLVRNAGLQVFFKNHALAA